MSYFICVQILILLMFLCFIETLFVICGDLWYIQCRCVSCVLSHSAVLPPCYMCPMFFPRAICILCSSPVLYVSYVLPSCYMCPVFFPRATCVLCYRIEHVVLRCLITCIPLAFYSLRFLDPFAKLGELFLCSRSNIYSLLSPSSGVVTVAGVHFAQNLRYQPHACPKMLLT